MNDPHDQGGPEPERNVGRDALGLALMAVAAFTGVSAFLAVRSPDAAGGRTSSFFVTFVGWLGGLPTLAAAAGLAWIGVRLWLGGVSDRIGRDLAGIAATSVALAALFGAVSQGLGGAVGDLLGGSVSRTLTAFVGVPFGLALLAFPAWFFWLRPQVVRAAPAFDVSQPVRPVVTESGSAEPPRHEITVTPLSRRRTEAETRNLTPSSPVRSAAPSPYPPDVRRTGGIPEGARPLETTDDRTTDARPHRTTALPELAPAHGERGGERARDDLAATAGIASLLRGEVHGGEGAADEPEGEPHRAEARDRAGLSATAAGVEADEPEAPVEAESESERASDGDRDDALALGEPGTEDEPVATLAEAAPTLPVERTPPAPSWEQPSLFDDEPVDAYGTPLSLVEGRQEASPSLPEREVASAPAVAEVDAGDETEAGLAREPATAAEAPFDDADEPEIESERADPIVVRDEDDPPAAEGERDVVIEPRPRRLAVDEVIYKAGCLFLDRKRVAVSMLQREFNLDFAAATAVLDQLQQLGLIGPYLGGQRRDILLTPEEWRERVGAP